MVHSKGGYMYTLHMFMQIKEYLFQPDVTIQSTVGLSNVTCSTIHIYRVWQKYLTIWQNSC